MSEAAVSGRRADDLAASDPTQGLPAPSVPLNELIRAAAGRADDGVRRKRASASLRRSTVPAVERHGAPAELATDRSRKADLLGLLLAHFMPKDMAQVEADELLARYGTLGGVVAAPTDRLAAQIRSADAARLLKAVRDIATELVREPIAEQPLIDSPSALDAYLRISLRHETVECVHLLFLNGSNRLIGEELHSRGPINHCPLYPREVVRRVIEMNANAIIIVHNHPGGNPMPSTQDVEMTLQLAHTLVQIGVSLHDHVIVGANGNFSFRGNGLLQKQ